MSDDFKRTLSILAGVIALAAVAYGGWLFFVKPWLDLGDQIASVEDDIDRKSRLVRLKLKERTELEKYRLISLPENPDEAQADYDRYLSKLLAKSGFDGEFLKPINLANQQQLRGAKGTSKKEPVYRPVLFEVRGRASLAALTKVLHEFKKTPLLHKIRTMHIEPVDKQKGSGDLRVNMTIEAIIVQGAGKKPSNPAGIDDNLVQLNVLTGLRGVPTGIPFIGWAIGPKGPLGRNQLVMADVNRDYGLIAKKNIFIGYVPKLPEPPAAPEPEAPQAPDLRRYTFLYGIVSNEVRKEAYLYNRYTNRDIRLREPPSSHTGFSLMDDENEEEQMKGEVIRISYPDVYFKANGEVYRIRIGENLFQAMRNPVKSSELEELGIKSARK